MRKYYPASVISRTHETADSIRLVLSVADSVADQFHYLQGQHLPVRANIDGKNVRRTYSICASVADRSLQLGIRVQPDGVFSNYAANRLQIGDTLDVMPPTGNFRTPLRAEQTRRYAAFVAGSGITPILSIVKTTLESEPASQFDVFYANRRRATSMFIEELWALKNLYPERLALHFIMSQEPSEIAVLAGRLDAEKIALLHHGFLSAMPPDDVFVCGPNAMIDAVTDALLALGYAAEQIHSERFRPRIRDGAAPARKQKPVSGEVTHVAVIMDGQRRTFTMAPDDTSILDAARRHGIELPYSCKGGVCSTCRTRLVKGKVAMDVNYALEPWELEKGYILACQARAKSPDLEIDYDQT